MPWEVRLKKKVLKQIERLPIFVKEALIALLREMEVRGPVRGNWPNFKALTRNLYHCHLKKGRPTYVAVWEVLDKEIKLIEVVYVGTHEKAPY
jgi:mRNA-degrading endonuclease RelE of RelBE toxin-antitoxin system